MTRAGARVAGRYVVEHVIGEGGMGIVVRARDERLDRSVALKLLRPAALGDGDARLRMLREAQAAARLEHPGIVRVHDTGPTDDGGQYVAMELVPGRSLRQWLRDGLPRQTAVRLVVEVARALAAAHRAGLVHRDVKPDNVMVTPEGRAVLLDFGIARTLDAGRSMLTEAGTILGTPGYLAPEQARGQTVDGRADQYALAVTLYELLSGRLPWPAPTPVALLAATLADPPEPLGGQDAVHAALEAVLARALAKDARERFSDCEAFAAALEEAAREGTPVSASAATAMATPERVAVPPTRRGEETASPRATARPPGARAPVVVVAAVALAALGVALVWARAPGRDVALEPGGAGLASDALLACVPLELESLPDDDAFLSVAAATDACLRLGWARGGGPGTRSPAQLVDLPVALDADGPVDPWSDPALRARARDRGRELAAATLEGRLAERAGRIELTLELRAPGGAVLATARGTGVGVYAAVIDATDALLLSGALARPDALEPSIARWYGIRDPMLALAASDVIHLSNATDVTGERCAELLPRRDELGVLQGRVAACCDWPPLATPTPHPVAALLDDARARGEDPVEALGRARDAEPTPVGRASLALAECRLLLTDRDTLLARNACLAAAAVRPEDPLVWTQVLNATIGTPTEEMSMRAMIAWHPGEEMGWNHLGLAQSDPQLVIRYLRRGLRLAPLGTSVATDLTLALVGQGRLGEARVLVAGMSAPSEPHLFARAMLDVLVTSAEGHPGQVVERLPDLIARMPRFGVLVQQDIALTFLLVELALVLGERGPAERFLHHVLDEPRLGDVLWVLSGLVSVALVASPDVRAWALARIRELDAQRPFTTLFGGRELLEAATALERGENERALVALRPLAVDARPCWPGADPSAVAASIEAIDPELASRFDAAALELPHGLVGGAWSAVAREARRAARRGDAARARALATRAVEGWSVLDRAPPDLDGLRALTSAEVSPHPP